MSLRIIYGKAGTGKSTYCFNEIKEHTERGEQVYIITPEQFSYSTERELLNTLPTGASINAEVISFNRLANRVFTEVGGLNDIVLSKSSQYMLIYWILEKEKNKLKFLGKSNDNVELVLKEISEFKKHNLTNEIINRELNKLEDPLLKEKITEINNIFTIYNQNIREKFIDEEDILSKLYAKIPFSTIFDNSIVYFDEFAGFTKQELNIFTEILKKAKQVNVIICTDNLDTNTKKENDIFYFNKQFIKLLTECGQNVDRNKETSMLFEEKYRFKNKELMFLEENLYNSIPQKYNGENKNIELFVAKSPYSEIEHIANQISNLVMNEGYKYKDIAIITKDIDNISNIVKAVFTKYKIPVFFDEKFEITENILIKYVLSILEIFKTNWNRDSVFNYMKSGFLDIENNTIYEIENYCKKNGINRNKFYKTEWKEYEEDRKNIVVPLIELKNKIEDNRTAQQITEKLYDFIIKQNIPEKLNNKIKSLNNINEKAIVEEYKASLDILVECLNEISIMFGDNKISIDLYIELLKIRLKKQRIWKDSTVYGSGDFR